MIDDHELRDLADMFARHVLEALRRESILTETLLDAAKRAGGASALFNICGFKDLMAEELSFRLVQELNDIQKKEEEDTD